MKPHRLIFSVMVLVFLAIGCKKKEPTPVNQVAVTEVLCKAIKDGDLDRVDSLMSSGIDINERIKGSWTALHHAAVSGHRDVVELLIAKGADIDVKDEWERTPLLLAIERKKKDGVAELLITKRADVNVMGQDGDTSLLAALRNSNENLAELLITKGAEVNVLARTPLQTNLSVIQAREPLHYAALFGFEHVTELLIAKGAKVDARDRRNDGYTPLHEAVAQGHEEVVKILIANGADVNAKTKPWHGGDGKTAMDIASEAGHADIVELLRTKGDKFGISNSIDN